MAQGYNTPRNFPLEFSWTKNGSTQGDGTIELYDKDIKIYDFSKIYFKNANYLNNNGIIEINYENTLPHSFLKDRNTPNQHTIDSIINLRSEIDKFQFFPDDVNLSNKLITINSVRELLELLRFIDLIDVSKSIGNEQFLYMKDGIIISKSDTDIKRYIDKIIDINNNEFNKVSHILLPNFEGKVNNNNTQLILETKLWSKNIIDMPIIHNDNKILISNAEKQQYELRSIEELVDSYENFHTTIQTEDWSNYENNLYSQIIHHDLNSINIIIACYTEDNNNIYLEYKIVDSNNIIIYSLEKKIIRVVVNASQGSSKDINSGIFKLETWQFIDDYTIRDNRSFSSEKIMDLLKSYALRTTIYTQEQIQNLFSLKSMEHIHTNKSIIDGFAINSENQLTFNGEKITTSVEPYYYEKHGKDKEFIELTEEISIREIYDTMKYKTIVACELSIKNEKLKENDEELNISKSLQLVIEDSGIEELNVSILPEDVQRYVLGISPNKKIFMKGNFSYNLYISAF